MSNYINLMLNDLLTYANARRVMLIADQQQMLIIAQAEGARPAHALEVPLLLNADTTAPISFIQAGFAEHRMVCVKGDSPALGPMDERLKTFNEKLYFSIIPVGLEGDNRAVIYLETTENLYNNHWLNSMVFSQTMNHFRKNSQSTFDAIVEDQANLTKNAIEEELKKARMLSSVFLDQMMGLHEVVLKLMKTENLSQLIKQAIELSRSRLHFDRIAVFFIDHQTQKTQCTFGVNDKGEIVDIQDQEFDIPNHPRLHSVISRPDNIYVDENTTLWENGKDYGIGWNAVVGLWVNNQSIGYISADNLLKKRPIQPYQKEIMRMLALNLAQLIDQKRRDQEFLALHKQLETLSKIDELTGLSNRRTFNETLNQEWQRAQRNNSSISILMLDLDYFKQFNDIYGHGQGDEALKACAKVFTKFARRAGELAARYGGEEFTLILPGLTCEQSEQTAKQIVNEIHDLAIEHNGSDLYQRLTVSIGVALLTPNINSKPQTLLTKADDALYSAKDNGRNTACIWTSGNNKVIKK